MHPIPGNPGNEQPGQAGAGASVVAAQRAVLGDGVRKRQPFGGNFNKLHRSEMRSNLERK